MRRISPVLVLLLAAGCANAGITDWLNPFRAFGGKHPGGQPGSPSGAQHSPKHSGHRGPRQLHSSGPSGPSHAPQSSQLGSPPGHLDDGFKPSFPPGFANPPSHSPNLNPFATSAGQGAETLGKGPFLPSQLTNYHTPNPPPHTPLVKPAPAPSPGGVGPRHRGRFPFGGKGRRPMPPHAAVASGSSVPDGSGPVGPDGAPVDYNEFAGLSSPMSPPSNSGPEYEETPTTPPEAAPQRGPRQSLFQRLTGRRPSGPPPSYNSHGGRHQSQFGGRPSHHGGPPGSGGPPSGPQGPDGPSYLDGSGPESQNPFGNNGPLSGPPGGRPGNDVFYATSPGSNAGFIPSNQDQGSNGGPSPFGSQSGPGGPSPFNNPQNGGPSPFGGSQSGPGGPSPFGGPQSGPGGPSPYGNSLSGGPSPYGNPQSGGPSPYGNPQSSGPYGGPGGPGGPQGLFGGSESGPQGPPGGGPGGPGGPSFFAPNGNDYPEQYEGGPRGPRQPSPLSPGDYRPQIGGPPETAGADEQNPGFYGALHNDNHSPQLSSFFGGSEGGPGGPGGPPSYGGPSNNSPYGGSPGGPPGGLGGSPGIYGGGPASPGGRPGYAQPSHQRKPPLRSFLRNPLAAAFGSSSNNVPAYGNPLAMSASASKPSTLPVPKGSRLLRPFQRKPGVIIPLSSPKDPNYRPMRLGASSLSPITAPYEPDTAASGGYHNGGFGDVGLSPNGDRILYHVAGHQGPYSYRFGFDTGKGYNRIFRFEEKDGKGYVKGKYGFYDKYGKLNLINYQAHPQHGYHAERGHSHGYY